MSIFDNLLRPSESDRIKTAEQSYEFISNIIEEYHEFIDMSSHTPHRHHKTRQVIENTYKFTVRLLSLDFLNKVSKDKRVKNLFFSSRHSHPGGGSDSISLRQRVIIEYY